MVGVGECAVCNSKPSLSPWPAQSLKADKLCLPRCAPSSCNQQVASLCIAQPADIAAILFGRLVFLLISAHSALQGLHPRPPLNPTRNGFYPSTPLQQLSPQSWASPPV